MDGRKNTHKVLMSILVSYIVILIVSVGCWIVMMKWIRAEMEEQNEVNYTKVLEILANSMDKELQIVDRQALGITLSGETKSMLASFAGNGKDILQVKKVMDNLAAGMKNQNVMSNCYLYILNRDYVVAYNTTANADIAKQEREIELKQKQVAVTEQSLEAEVKKKAEAEKYAAQQRAEAELYQRQKDAEAKQFEAQREAEAQKAQAEAMRFAREQEAAGIRAVGEAEASAIQAKGIAEAEAMEKKAEAYAKYNKAAVAEMMIKVLPDIAGKVAEPLGQIDKITIIGGGEGGSNGVDQIAGNVPVVMAKVFESMKEATGIDLADIINAESYDAKVNRNVNVSGLDSVNFVVKDDGTKVTMAKVEPQNSTKPVSTDVPESGEQG